MKKINMFDELLKINCFSTDKNEWQDAVRLLPQKFAKMQSCIKMSPLDQT